MNKYTVRVRVGLHPVEEQELEWDDKDYENWENGDRRLESEVRGIAHELVNLEFWVEKITLTDKSNKENGQ